MPPLVVSQRVPSRLDRFVEMQDFLDSEDEGFASGDATVDADAFEGPDPHDPYGI
jgi:hypothetical protein